MTKPKPKAAKPARKAPPRKTVKADAQRLTAKQERFVQEYVIDSNATRAAIRSGYSAKTADVIGGQLLRKAWVALAITNAQRKVTERVENDADAAYRQAFYIATADAREITQLKHSCCGYCYPAEIDEDTGVEKTYDRTRPANPKCVSCIGEGIARVVLTDTDKLSPAAAALFAGVEVTKNGIRVRMHDKLAALEKVFRFHGLYAKENEQIGAAALAFAELHTRVMGGGSRAPAVAAPPNAHAHQ